ncbi:M23 family metallopeptidase [Flavobacterium sp. ALJ2]|uniref:M23 family metallopeptidase n=1 Tax=Flavobacterium sp. ALJ2 TaxID=2786960 RepID=UPI00189FF679|nr:M23 family metallopeptidase [Flavobacterium sp. ALJ2]MBF7092868.1 M23 family metallopeptidase [Flavobacterium sp. ALJ2]
MNKNAIHNFNLSIKNSAAIKSSEDLTKAIIKELANVSKEMSQQKDIVQLWQESKSLNTTAVVNNSSTITEGGTSDASIETIKKTALSESNNSSVFKGTIGNHNTFISIISSEKKGTSNALIGGGVADTNGRTIVSSTVSDNTTPPIIGADNNMLNFSSGLTTQTYASVATQQTLTVPQMLQKNSSEPTIEVVKVGIKKRLDLAITANNSVEIEYWRGISNAFDEGATAQDFDGKKDQERFTKMYFGLQKWRLATIDEATIDEATINNVNWGEVSESMIFKLSQLSKEEKEDRLVRYYNKLIKEIRNPAINIPQLFSEHDELFLLLKSIFPHLPAKITIQTQKGSYPDLSPQKMYPDLGVKDMYFIWSETQLDEVVIKNDNIQGSDVDKGAVKIKNEVVSIGQAKEVSKKAIFLLGNPDDTLTLEAKTFKINPATDEEKENVKWLIYDSNNKLYPPGAVLLTENKDPQKSYLHKWSSFTMAIPQKEGRYKVEAYSDSKKGAKANCIFEIEVRHPQVKEAQWTYVSGDLKKVSGFSGEENHIKASIPGYINQKVIIYFLVDGKRNTTQYITKTNDAGIVNRSIKFDDAFKKQLGLTNKKNSTLQFIVEGEINGKTYAFKKARNKLNDSILINVEKKIVDTYFVYDDNRVTPFTQVPYGAKVTGVVKTLNMVGKEIVLKVYKRNAEYSQLRVKTIVNNEGVATISFVLNKNWQVINPFIDLMDMFYLGMDGFESKLSLENGLNAVVGSVIKSSENLKEKFDENDPQLIWGAKVSKEFRVKVVEIAKKLKVDPNWIMIIIAKETSLTFDPHIDNGIGYVGLIQFSEVSAKEVGTTHMELKNMTAETQLNYVGKRLARYAKNGYKSLSDLYLAVLNPSSVGEGNKDGNVLWTSSRMAYYNNPSYHKEKGEYDNKINIKGKTKRGFDGGTTYMWEVRQELERIEKEGEKFDKMVKALPLEIKYKNWTLNEITSGYGKRDVKVGSKFHKGLDFNYSGGGDTDIGAPIFSTHDGFVHELKDDASGTTGRYILVRSENSLFQTKYLHLSKIVVKKDEKIKKGQKIGELGASYKGKEKGGDISAHLHYEIMTLVSKANENVYNQIDPTDGHGKNKIYLIDPQDWIK